MSYLKFKKLAPLFLWPLALWTYLIGRIFCMNFLKTFLFIAFAFGMHLKSVLYANELTKTPWVIDEHQILSQESIIGLTQILSESAKNRNVHVRMIVLVEEPNESTQAAAKRHVVEWENRDPSLALNKTVYFVIHALSGQSDILLGKNLSRNDFFQENISRIKEGIILPILATGNIEKAAIEGVIGLTTVLEELPYQSQISIFETMSAWLQSYHLLVPLKILFGFSLVLAIVLGLRRYLRRPDWEEMMPIEVISIEEKMLLESLAFKRESSLGSEHIQ